MTNEQAQKLIVLATFVTIGSTSADILRKPKKQKKPLKTNRVIIGGFFAMVGCSLLAEADPLLGAGLAALVTGGAFFNYGLPVLEESFKEEKKKEKK